MVKQTQSYVLFATLRMKQPFIFLQIVPKLISFWLTFIIFRWKFKTSFTESTVCHFWFFRYQSRYIFSFKSYFIIIQAFYFYWVGGWVTLCEITVFFTLSSCNYVYIASCFLFIPVRQLHGQSRQWGP